MSESCSSCSVRFLSQAAAWRSFGRTAAASVLLFLLAGAPTLAQSAAIRGADASRLANRQQVDHALNRFTFGPRPGEAAAIEKVGLKRWFDQQLDPDGIDDSALEARLAAYPAMQLSLSDLETKYPSPAMIRGMAIGRMPLPQDATARTLASDQIAFYKQKNANKAGDQAEAASPAASAVGGPRVEIDNLRLQQLLALSPDERLAAILALGPEQLTGLRQSVRGAAGQRLSAGMDPGQRETLLALGGSNRMIAGEEMDSRILRDVYSQRQLQAVMTDFWLNHFNVYLRKNQNEPYLIPSLERAVRAHALGSFEDLLVATAESPAMLEYLDNARSVGADSSAAHRVDLALQRNPDGPMAKNASAGLNENYARELMELHTLGVQGGYTQTDVTEVAKVFTGWTVAKPADGGGFQFDERRHEPGTKLVLGRKIQENGQKEGLEVLHMLASSPATAHLIAQQLAVRFVSDNPPPALVDRMAGTFLSSHGDIRSVLRTLFDSPEFWSPAVYRAKLKTPEEFVFSAARASDLQIENPASLVQSLQRLGMPLYGMPTPNGYSWRQDGWLSTGALVNRMNFALVLSGDRLPGTRTDWDGVTGTPAGAAGVKIQATVYGVPTGPATAAQQELRLEQVLLSEAASPRTRAAVLSEANDSRMTDQAETNFNQLGANGPRVRPGNASAVDVAEHPRDECAAIMAGLLLGSPEFQRR